MVIDISRAPSTMSALQSDHKTLLVKVGEGDDSLFYQVSVAAVVDRRTFMVTLHQTSLTLERLRLHGTLTARVQRADGVAFYAELALVSDLDEDRCTAKLTLHNECDECLTSPRFLPLT